MFDGDDAWQSGPRDAILGRIENRCTVVRAAAEAVASALYDS